MEITISEKTNLKQVNIDGELTSDNVNKFKEKIYPLFYTDSITIAINMNKISHIDSTGIGSLVGAIKVAKAERKEFILYDIPEKIKKFFDDIGLQNFFKILSLKEFTEKYK